MLFTEHPSPSASRSIGIIILIAFIAAIAVIGALKVEHWLGHNQDAPAIAVLAKPATEVKNIPLVSITPAAPIKVYAQQAKAKLRLPPAIVADDTQHVSTTARIASRDNPQTVTTIFDEKTGESVDYVTQEPMPWMAVDLRGEVGLAYGIKNSGQTVRLSVQQNLIDVKSVRIGIAATVDQPISGPVGADYFVGAGAWYRW